MLAVTDRAFPGLAAVALRRTVPRGVLLRTVATCCRCLALGSYVAISLTLEPLLQTTLPDVPLALTQPALPHQPFIDDLVRVLCSCELDDDRGSRFARGVLCEPSDVFDLSSGKERTILLQYALSDPFELVHVHRSDAYYKSNDPVCWVADVCAVPNPVGPVICKLS